MPAAWPHNEGQTDMAFNPEVMKTRAAFSTSGFARLSIIQQGWSLQSVVEKAVWCIFIRLNEFRPFDALAASSFNLPMKYLC
jgi:hypothetical protein